MNGIDVSKHQGIIDWGKVKAIDFAIIRAGHGKYAVNYTRLACRTLRHYRGTNGWTGWYK